MESRKLISFGSSSYVVTLPKSWIEKNKLNKGNSIYVDERSDELVISPNDSEQNKKAKEIQIDATNKSIERVRTELVSAYLNNCDLIEIRNVKEADMPAVKDHVKNLAGLEIMEQTSSKIVSKDLINVREVSIKTLIRRIDIIVRSLIDDVMMSLQGKEDIKDVYESIYQRDTDVNRLVFLVRRMMTAALEDTKIAKIFDTNPMEILSDWEVVIRLEKLGDQTKRIARSIKATTAKNEFVEKLFMSLRERYLSVMKAYYSSDREMAFMIENTTNSQIDDITGFFKNLSAEDQEKLGIGPSCMHISVLNDNLKSMATSIRNIARTIIVDGK